MKELLDNQIKIVVSLFTALTLSSSFALADFKNVDCIKNQKKLAISTAECQLLEKLWTTTNGKDWLDNHNWDSLTKVDTWEGVTVENGKISSILLYSNNLRGVIPQELGKLSSLKILSFFNNKLSGEVPESLGELAELTYLDLGNNNLNGAIPQTLGLLSNLKEFYLNNNQFSGNIPDSLGDLEKLTVLKMYGNNLLGSIPRTFGALSNLKVLSLAENNLTGDIPSELGELRELTYLDLKSNKLTGAIPVRIGSLESLTGLYLQKNRLTGAIPFELGNLSNLTDLDLSDNKLMGTIPHSLGNLSDLTYLNVAKNELSGDLPSELLNLSKMNYLNLENNRFVSSNIEPIYKDLLEIPKFIISPKLIVKEADNSRNIESKRVKELSEKSIATTIKVLNEDEIAMLELATLKIVGTKEVGESLFVKNEGRWRIEDNKIIFMPIDGFTDAPTSIFYTIKNNNGVELSPIEVSVKRNKTEAFKINVLENESNNLKDSLVKISLPDDFLKEHTEFILSEDKKELIVDSEGIWSVENNGSIIFSPEDGFIGKPSDIGYLVFADSGEKSAIGIINMKHMDDNLSQIDSVGLFGWRGLLLMMFFGGLFGMFYMREINNKKIKNEVLVNINLV